MQVEVPNKHCSGKVLIKSWPSSDLCKISTELITPRCVQLPLTCCNHRSNKNSYMKDFLVFLLWDPHKWHRFDCIFNLLGYNLHVLYCGLTQSSLNLLLPVSNGAVRRLSVFIAVPSVSLNIRVKVVCLNS